jgi:hypothetical protein
VKAGWWPTLIPSNVVASTVHVWFDTARAWVGKRLS